MSCLSVFPPPPSDGEITLCEFNARLISESSETADVSKYVPATQVMSGQTFIVSVYYIPLYLPVVLPVHFIVFLFKISIYNRALITPQSI